MEANLALEYIITHVFCPLRLPGADDHTYANDQELIAAVVDAANEYSRVVADTGQSEWPAIARMLENLAATVQSARLDINRVISQLEKMQSGDVLSFFIRAQNASVVFQKEKDVTVYAAFELSPQAGPVIMTRGKLLCSYPGPAIEIPNAVFSDTVFRSELANFLVCMNEDMLDASTGSLMLDPTALERRDTADPRHITELLTGILRGVGRPATTVVRVTKRIGDDVVVSGGSPLPWRRSSLWLLVRVAIQTTLEPSPQGHDSYKGFVIFFLARLAEEAIRADLPNDLLYFMSTKISRRLRKLGPLAPCWLTEATLDTCSRIRGVLDDRWEQIQASERASPPHVFSTLNFTRDVKLSLLYSPCQDACHKDISIHEFIAFGHLRSGGSLQWLNILRELRDRSLSFRCTEVHLLLAQVIAQVGPLTGTELRWHKELRHETFGHAIVNELESFVADVEANWLEGVTMNTISLLLSRILASNPDQAVSEKAIELLRAVRTKSFSWVRELSDKLTRTPGDDELRGALAGPKPSTTSEEPGGSGRPS
ncbi:hypothetical protein OG21DRAFT_1605625 [Imleria badia]|nr:hypothetical protein OG21DRAFT_1605625 [Imleria badia]